MLIVILLSGKHFNKLQLNLPFENSLVKNAEIMKKMLGILS
jgi:hypothetical protein